MADTDPDSFVDVELAASTLELAICAVEDSLDSLELDSDQLAYDAALKLSQRLTERVRRLRYKIRA